MISTVTYSTTQEALRRIRSFCQRFGDGHFYLACHAALPIALTPELLYQLWANFQCDSNGDDLSIPWIAVSDILLSKLCEEVGSELYEMDNAIREELLKQLREHQCLGLERLHEVSDFIIAYTEAQLDSLDQDTKDFATAQKWRALAYKDPAGAAREIAIALSQLSHDDSIEWIRMETLLEALSKPLHEYRSLLIYARAFAALARGNLQGALDQLSQILTSDNQIQVVNVNLPIPKIVAINLIQPKQQHISVNPFRQPRWLVGGGIIGTLAIALVGSYFFYISQLSHSNSSLVGSATPSPQPNLPETSPPQNRQTSSPSPTTIAVNPASPNPATSPAAGRSATPSPQLNLPKTSPPQNRQTPSPSPTTIAVNPASPNPATSPADRSVTPSPQSNLPTTSPPQNGPALLPSRDSQIVSPRLNTPDQSVSNGTYSGVLLQGTVGSAVVDLQNRLSSAGYYNGAIDGVFGPQTEDAVLRLQRARGLTANGIAEYQVTQALAGSSTTALDTSYNPSGRQLTIGDSGYDVEDLQRRLQALGYFNGTATGYFGTQTSDAVQRFQQDRRLPVTGIADSRTLSPLAITTAGNNYDRVNRFVVVVPKQDSSTLLKVRQVIPGAFEARSALGDYVMTGAFPNQNRAEKQASLLRSRGLDARVSYSNAPDNFRQR